MDNDDWTTLSQLDLLLQQQHDQQQHNQQHLTLDLLSWSRAEFDFGASPSLVAAVAEMTATNNSTTAGAIHSHTSVIPTVSTGGLGGIDTATSALFASTIFPSLMVSFLRKSDAVELIRIIIGHC